MRYSSPFLPTRPCSNHCFARLCHHAFMHLHQGPCSAPCMPHRCTDMCVCTTFPFSLRFALVLVRIILNRRLSSERSTSFYAIDQPCTTAMAVQSLCFRISSPPCSPLNQMASPASLYLMPSSYSTACRRRVNRHRLAGLATLIWLADNILDFRHRIACHPIRCYLLPTHSRLSSYQQTFLTLHMPHCAHSTTHDRSLPQWPPTAYSVRQRHQTTAAYTRTRNQHKHCTITALTNMLAVMRLIQRLDSRLLAKF